MWQRALDDAGNPPFTDQAVDLAVPTLATQGVPTVMRPKTTIRVWNSSAPLAGGFDVELWELFDTAEGWFRNASVGTVAINAVSPTDRTVIAIESRGAIRVFVRPFNIAGGATASCRISVGTD
jgi:hypothetical protein